MKTKYYQKHKEKLLKENLSEEEKEKGRKKH